jgi:hypothetical protein
VEFLLLNHCACTASSCSCCAGVLLGPCCACVERTISHTCSAAVVGCCSMPLCLHQHVLHACVQSLTWQFSTGAFMRIMLRCVVQQLPHLCSVYTDARAQTSACNGMVATSAALPNLQLRNLHINLHGVRQRTLCLGGRCSSTNSCHLPSCAACCRWLPHGSRRLQRTGQQLESSRLQLQGAVQRCCCPSCARHQLLCEQ